MTHEPAKGGCVILSYRGIILRVVMVTQRFHLLARKMCPCSTGAHTGRGEGPG